MTTSTTFKGGRPGNYTFYAKQGAYWARTIRLQNNDGTPKDISGYDFKMQIREKHEGPVIKELSNDAGTITVDVATASITPTMTPEDTAAFSFSKVIYDIFAYPTSGNDFCFLEGEIVIGAGVTR
jgi:hypothetical protein